MVSGDVFVVGQINIIWEAVRETGGRDDEKEAVNQLKESLASMVSFYVDLVSSAKRALSLICYCV